MVINMSKKEKINIKNEDENLLINNFKDGLVNKNISTGPNCL